MSVYVHMGVCAHVCMHICLYLCMDLWRLYQKPPRKLRTLADCTSGCVCDLTPDGEDVVKKFPKQCLIQQHAVHYIDCEADLSAVFDILQGSKYCCILEIFLCFFLSCLCSLLSDGPFGPWTTGLAAASLSICTVHCMISPYSTTLAIWNERCGLSHSLIPCHSERWDFCDTFTSLASWFSYLLHRFDRVGAFMFIRGAFVLSHIHNVLLCSYLLIIQTTPLMS